MLRYALYISSLTIFLLVFAYYDGFSFMQNMIVGDSHALDGGTGSLVSEIASGTVVVLKEVKEVITSSPLKVYNAIDSTELTVLGTIVETNNARALHGKTPLVENAKLSQAAYAKAYDMLSLGYFEHVSPLGLGPSDVIDNAGYEYIVVGENLALGHFKDDKALVEAWMNSPGHRENIISEKFSEIGVGIVRGVYEGEEVWIAVQEFGKPLSSCPSVDDNRKELIRSLENQASAIENRLDSLRKSIDKEKEGSRQYRIYVEEYNKIIEEYNTLINAIKDEVALYNKSVETFNACVEAAS